MTDRDCRDRACLTVNHPGRRRPSHESESGPGPSRITVHTLGLILTKGFGIIFEEMENPIQTMDTCTLLKFKIPKIILRVSFHLF